MRDFFCSPNRKLIVITVRFYFNGMGGNHGFAFWCTFIGGLIVYEMFKVLQTWWLGHWARQYEEMPTSEVKALLYALRISIRIDLILTIVKFPRELRTHPDSIRGSSHRCNHFLHTRNTKSIQDNSRCIDIVRIISHAKVNLSLKIGSTATKSNALTGGSTEPPYPGLSLDVRRTLITVCTSSLPSDVVRLTPRQRQSMAQSPNG